MRTPHILGDAGVSDEVKRLRDGFRYPDELGGDGAVLVGGGGGAPTIVVAPSNSSSNSLNRSDVQLSGTDDQEAVERAMNDLLPAFGGRVWFTEGTLSFSATLNVPASNMIHIEGVGWQAVQIEMATPGIDMITLADADTNLVLRDMQFNGLSQAGTGLLVSAGASLYVTHCQFLDINTVGIDANNQFVIQVIDTLIQRAATGIIYRHATGRGHLSGNDFETNTTDISIVDTAGTVVTANRSTGATTFLSRTAGTVYAWANDDGGAAYVGVITKAHNAEGIGAHGAAFVGARVYDASTQSVNDNSWTSIAMDSERFDSDAFHDTVTNNSRITVPAGKAGKYLIGGTLGWSGGSSVGRRGVRIYYNGTTEIATILRSGVDSSPQTLNVNTVYELAVGDYVELQGYQNSGGARNTSQGGNFSPEFWVSFLGV